MKKKGGENRFSANPGCGMGGKLNVFHLGFGDTVNLKNKIPIQVGSVKKTVSGRQSDD